MTRLPSDPPSPISSLGERRREKNKRVLQESKTDRVRILELEIEVARLVELLLDTTERLDSQSKYLQRVLTALRTSR